MVVKRFRSGREAPLFSALLAQGVGEPIVPGDDAFVLYRGWLAVAAADALLEHIRGTIAWTQERRTMYDRVVDVPREQAWLGDRCERPFSAPLDTVRRDLETLAGERFAYVLLNRYRDGRDSVAWHNDRSVTGIDHQTIASLTLGATRAFDLRAKSDPGAVTSVELDHGDLVVMRPSAQRTHDHRIRKDPRVTSGRINLTFRSGRVDRPARDRTGVR